MKYLVSTRRFLLLVDIETHAVVPLEETESGFYGISWFKGDSRLVLTDYGMVPNPNDDFDTLARSERGFVTVGTERTQRFLSAPHQMVCASDGRIICTNTGRNSIVAFDPIRSEYLHEVRLTEGRWDRWDPDETSGDHLNSVFQKGDRLYVIAHRHNKNSWLATLSYPEMKVLNKENIGELVGVHNVWIADDGSGITCASHLGGIADVRTGELLWAAGGQAGESIYTRGLSISDDFIVVGESVNASRDKRMGSGTGLWLINRQTMRTEDYIWLGPLGGVHEVRLLDAPDHAHHAHPFAGLEYLLASKPLASRRAARINSSRVACSRLPFWQLYRDVLGGISFEEEGWMAEQGGMTCLIVQTAANDSDTITIDYELIANESESHVSLVVGYNGGHSDAEMTAVLIQPSFENASMRLWRSSEGEWSHAPDAFAEDFPLTGTVRAVLNQDGLEIAVSNGCKLMIDRNTLGSDVRPLGVRWRRARVRVATME